MPWYDLPTEVWMEIFRYASYCRAAVSLSPQDPFETTTVSEEDVPKSSMRTKCALALVCRTWNPLATELLFEYLEIDSSSRAGRILDVLKGTHDETARDMQYGRRTRHIVVSSSWFMPIQLVQDILCCCPELRVLSINWSRGSLPFSFLGYVSQLYGNSLKELSWAADASWSDKTAGLGAFHKFLASFSRLRILDISQVGLVGHLRLSNVFTDIEELVLSPGQHAINVVSSSTLPALRRVVCYGLTTSFSESQFESLLEACGTGITSFHISHSASSKAEPFRPDSGSRNSNLTALLRPSTFPRLCDLTFDAYEPVIGSLAEPHPTLRRVALRGVAKVSWLDPDEPNAAHAHMERLMSGNFPALKVVRLPDLSIQSAADRAEATKLFCQWNERFNRNGIEFQVGDGYTCSLHDVESA